MDGIQYRPIGILGTFLGKPFQFGVSGNFGIELEDSGGEICRAKGLFDRLHHA